MRIPPTHSCLWRSRTGSRTAPDGLETVVQPAGSHGLGSQLADALNEAAVSRHENDASGCGRSLLNQSVVAVMGGVDDTHTVDICLSNAGAGGAFEDDHRRQREAPMLRRLAEAFNELVRGACSVPPPSGGPRPDDIGGVDHEHVP
jgi:hypothetical protein